MRHTQRGFTFFGLMLFSAFLLFAGYTAMRLMPAYMDYWMVQRAVVDLAANPELVGEGDSQYRDAFEKRMRLNNIDTVNRRALVVEKTKEGVRLSAAWTVRTHYIRQINLCLDFRAESTPAPTR